MKDPLIEDYKIIHQAIKDKVVKPFLSETIFTLEAINRGSRKSFVSSRKLKTDIKEHETIGNMAVLSFSIGPGKGIDFDSNPVLKKHFEDAVSLGFNICRFPRVAGLINEDIEPYRFRQKNEDLKTYHDKAFEVERRIEEKGAGISHIKQIGRKYNELWIEGIKTAPESERNAIANAMAEWADGDSVAICIALGCDYFCTMDQAKKAGEKSVLSKVNLEWLNKEYGLRIVKPEELSKLIFTVKSTTA